ncbi:FAD/NAD(P)-binding protein [Luteimonas changyuni]|uniref:FAD/NAD(P)-binding protein n=1 Tax=Luteimonas sp. MJ145 TaxID=3129234 RepID=UPI0031BB29A3
MPSPDTSRFDVVVVGGGASGALVATHLLGDGACPHTVALVEARPAMAEGVAYSTRSPEHLLNVRAAGMSAFGDRPEDFVSFLEGLPEHAGQDRAALGARFMPRMVYARYLAALAEGRPGLERLCGITDAAVDVVPLEDGFEVVLASGSRLQARAVVLAVGNRPARLPLADGSTSGLAVVEAWDYAGVAAIPPDADVCILGAGLSMVDVVLALGANGHRGRITSLSRSGLMPLPHAEPAPPAEFDVAGLLAEPRLRARLRAVRRVAAREQAQGRPWQAVMDALRPHVQALWTSLDAVGQQRFLRHLVRHWDVHRHRIAPEVARQLDAATASGQLQRLAGRLVAVEGGPRPGITWRPRGGDGQERFKADVLVNALGVDKRIDVGDGLLARLCVRGLLRPGPHRIGAATAPDGAPLGANGAPVPGLWTLGALRVGDLWESIAMPELRGQARDVAAAVRAHLDAAGP